MSNNNVLENFFKIAQEKGLISEDAPEKAKKILERTHRADSLSEEDIAKLYGIKVEMAKGNEYKKNIMEDAHPTSYIAAPSHDKLNGLVENNIERQNIIINIVNKIPDGHLTQHKYAEKDLILSLVRLGNDLDNRSEDKLRALADTCLMQVAQPQLQKKAFVQTAVLIAIPILLGSLYVQQHMSFINEGFDKNHNKLIAEIDDLLTASASWGVGYDYKSEFKDMVQDFKSKLVSFHDLYDKVEPLITDLERPRTAKDLIALSKAPATNSVVKAYGTLKSAASNMLPYIVAVEKNFSSESYKARQIEDKGFMSSLVDKTQIFHGGKGLVADDFDDVVRAIAPYKKSVAEMVSLLKNAESIEKSAQQKIQDAAADTAELTGEKATEAPSAPTNGKGKAPGKPKSIDDEVADLEKDLSDGL
jgi:hypothetical protein